MLNNKKFLLPGIGLSAFIFIGVASTLDAALAHRVTNWPHLGLSLVAGILYFRGVTKLSQAKHKAAIATTLGLAVSGYVALVAFLLSVIAPVL
jgi:hypothetical protein